jgi:hypothetical protein
MDVETRRLLRAAIDTAARRRAPYDATGSGRWSAADLARHAAKASVAQRRVAERKALGTRTG